MITTSKVKITKYKVKKVLYFILIRLLILKATTERYRKKPPINKLAAYSLSYQILFANLLFVTYKADVIKETLATSINNTLTSSVSGAPGISSPISR